MTLRTGGGHRRHASSLREGDVLGRTGDAGQLTAINRSIDQSIKQSSNQAIKQSSNQAIKQVFLSQRNKGER
jgi:hypothetical protein